MKNEKQNDRDESVTASCKSPTDRVPTTACPPTAIPAGSETMMADNPSLAEESESTLPSTKHEQVSLPDPNVKGAFVEVDKSIAPLLQTLWQLDINTYMSCENNGGGMIWIEFDMYSVERFISIIANAAKATPGAEDWILERLLGNEPWKDTQRCAWKHSVLYCDLSEFADHEEKGAETERSEIFATASVRFPRQDYKFVLKAVKKAAKQEAKELRELEANDMPEMRSEAEISAAEEAFFKKLWYYRSKRYQDHEKVVHSSPTSPETQELIDKECLEIERLFPKEELPPWDAYQYGEVCGKLSALRWMLGDEWDMLDT